MEDLNELELEVLENLPVQPVGVSLAELADDLLGSRGPSARGKIRRALERISGAIGGLHMHTGNDDFGGARVKMFGIPTRKMPRVRRFFAEKSPANV